MARGGRRLGAGRKPGLVNTKTRIIAEQAMAEGVTPLEVLLHAMQTKLEEGDLIAAAALAKDAAPYVHPRLSAVQQSGADGGPVVTEVVYRWAASDEITGDS